MSAVAEAIDRLARANPGWTAWLSVTRLALEEAQRGAWDAMVGRDTVSDPSVPLLGRMPIALDRGRIERLLDDLVRRAAAGDAPQLQSLAGLLGPARAVAQDLFRAALAVDDPVMVRIARECACDPGALRALASLLPVPFLHACARRWQEGATQAWTRGYCPVCASWPAFAEVCGVERRRWLRCGRCGSAWSSAPLMCSYCGTRDHSALGALVFEGLAARTVELCNRCKGYVKVLMTLQKSAPVMVMLEDLGSVELDIAAATRGYARPEGIGCVTLSANECAA